MIQKAIIEAIEDNYTVKVRIPKYDKTVDDIDGKGLSELSSGIMCSMPGTIIGYSVGDIVLVGFENDEISKPVVLGLLYSAAENAATLKVPEFSEALNSVNEAVDKLNSTVAYTHIKYSNDKGVSFTSLYDYSLNIVNNTSVSRNDIPISPNSTVIYWSIVDKNNKNAFDDFYVSTTVTAIYNEESYTYTSTEQVVYLPSEYSHYQQLYLSYSISVKKTTQINECSISLTTDIDMLGSIEGDYIGIYHSNSPYASLNPIDYSWCSIKTRTQQFIDEAYNKLLPRIQRNERSLFGVDQETTKYSNTNLGLESGVKVLEDATDLSAKKSIFLSSDHSVYVNTTKNELIIGNLMVKIVQNNHIQILKKEN